MRRRLTEPSALTTEFWKAAAEHRLVAPRCNRTGRYFFPPERCVPGTDSTDWSYVESGGRGTVYTFSVVYRPMSPDFEVPYIVAVVDLDEGCAMLTNIVDCLPDEIRVGMPVEVTFLDVEGGSLPVFRPSGHR
jgi:uncharacterized OB-fold protein